MSTDKATPRIADNMQNITGRIEAKAWLASINAPETEDRILWAQFLATQPSVNQIHLASKIALEERKRAASHFDEVVAALEKIVRDDPGAWVIPDTDGDTGADECFFCGQSEERKYGEPFKHDPTCAGLLARKALAAVKTDGKS